MCVLQAPVYAATDSELFELDLKDLLKVEIVTASRVSEPLARSAATTTVITAAELRSMGARTIYDALRHVPGLQVGTAQFGENYIAVRGIRSDWSEKILVLLDGHLLNDARSGSASFQFLDRLPVDNIARIEVMRGPGSALYGANAFLGVIHIITRRPAEIAGTELSASGEFESSNTVAGRYNLLSGGELGSGWHGSMNLNVLDASGAQLQVPADALGRAGEADAQEQAVDMQGRLENASFSLMGRYFSRDAGDQYGAVHVINGQSSQQVDYAFVDATYHPQTQGDTRLQVHAYLDHQDSDNYYVGLPAGVIPPTSPYFPWNGTGLIGDPQAEETLAGGEFQLEHRGLADHLLTAGLGYRYEKLHDPRFLANFDPAPLPEVTDVSAYYNWIEPASRSIASVYMQDLWDLTDGLRATLGARYDHFNDIGTRFNPRLGLTWHARPGVDARIMYGTAFRAPDFFSQHLQNNPTLLGNPDLDPEEIETLEAGLRLQLSAADAAEFTVFRSTLSQLIGTPSGGIQYQNLGEVTTPGAEVQWQHLFRNRASLTTAYAYANPDYEGQTLGILAAQQTVSLVLDMPLSARSHWHVNGYWQSDIDRAPGDVRADMDSYLLFNTAVSVKLSQVLDLSLTVFNLGDSDAHAPAAIDTLPNDYPVPGRSYLLTGRYRFD
jgi:iron complex outermembrane receptor protein